MRMLIFISSKTLHRGFLNSLASKLSCSLAMKMRKLIFISSKILHRKFCDSLVTLHKKQLPMKLALSIWGISQVTCEYFESRSYKMSGFLVFKRAKSYSFIKNFFLPPSCLSQPKTLFSLKSQVCFKACFNIFYSLIP